MSTMTESSTDKRVDDLRGEAHRGFEQVDRRFEQVDRRIAEFHAEVDRRFDRVEGDIRELRADNRSLRAEMNEGFTATQASLVSIHRLLLGFFATTLGSIIAGVILLLASHS
jgi:hypothetical protein